MDWVWDFKHLVFAYAMVSAVVFIGIIFWIAVLHAKMSDLYKSIEKVRAKVIFMEATEDALASSDYDHNFKIKSINNRFEDISNRVREIERALYDNQDDSK